MDNLLIHIGYHKTASSWLQQQLFTAESTVFEPVSRKKRGNSTFADYFIYGGDNYLLSPFDDNEMAIQDELQAIISNNDNFKVKIPVISHERLSGNPHSSGFDAKKIALMLKNQFSEARILIMIREQKSFILSNYFQYLSIGGTHSLVKYMNTKYDGKRPFFSPRHVNYLPLITEYCKLFGNDNVLVLPYEMFKNNNTGFINRLGGFLNVELNVSDEKFRKVVNKKENHFLMYNLRALNLFRRCSSVNDYSSLCCKFTRTIASAIINIPGAILPGRLDTILKNRLKLKIAKQVGGRYIESNKSLSELIGIDLSEYGYY